jgi:cysteine desulfurase
MRIYLDHNATAPLTEDARRAMTAATATAGNPSSIHAEGRAARGVVDDARARIAALVGGTTDEIVFTSGGTEACVAGVIGLARGGARRVVTTPIEHPAVAGACEALGGEGLRIERAPVDADGRLALDRLDALARGGGLIAIAAANHELGTVQDVAAIAAIARAHGARLFVDAVQAAGRAPLPPIAAVADAIAISAHKLGGPAGVGALWVRRGVELAPVVAAGHQERGRRAGTENVVGIAGFGAAAAAVSLDAAARVRALAARLEDGLAAQGWIIRARAAPRIGNTVNARAPGALGESIVIALDLAGVAASTGAACTSGSVKPSPVLLGLGEDERTAREAVRFSLGPTNTDEEIDRVLAILPAIVSRARS